MMQQYFKHTFFLAVLLLLIGSCGVDKNTYHSSMHQLPTELNLSDVYFVNTDTGYVSAGGIFTAGLILGTTDGGSTWDTLNAYASGINSLSYSNGDLTASQSGQRLHSSTDFINWAQHSTLGGWWSWHKHLRLPDDRVLLVGGENFGRGFLHIKDPTDVSIQIKDTFAHELRDIERTANRTIHACGYGLVMKSTDEANSWIISNLTGDFFRGIDFPSSNTGYVVGEYGSVYKTTNRGDSWAQCRAANAVFPDYSKLLRDLAFWDENNGFLVGTGNVVFRTADGGKTFQEVQTLDGYADFNAIRIRNNKAYLVGNSGQLLIIDLPS